MRRRPSWVDVLLKWLIIFLVVGYGSLFAFVPVWARAFLDQQLSGAGVTIGHIRLAFPAKLVCSNLVIATQQPHATISVDRVVLTPSWRPWRDRTLCVETADVRGVVVRVRRTAQGTLMWPTPMVWARASAPPNPAPDDTAPAGASPSWRVHVRTVRVSDGAVAFLDQKLAPPFRAALAQVDIIGGPLTVPLDHAPHVALAVHAQLVGAQERAATLSCSGWLNWGVQGVEMACRLDALSLAAFRPYYRLRSAGFYQAIVRATGQFSARKNVVDGRVQLTLGNLSEADVWVLRRSIEEAKRSGDVGEPSLTGELKIAGTLTDPANWTLQLAPGNLVLERLLASHDVEKLPVKVGTQPLQVEVTPANAAVMSDIEAASKTVTETLQVIAPPEVSTQASADSGSPPSTAPQTAASVESGTATAPMTPASSMTPPPVAPSEGIR